MKHSKQNGKKITLALIFSPYLTNNSSWARNQHAGLSINSIITRHLSE